MSLSSNRQEGIHALFEQHADELYRYIEYLSPAGIDAKDVVQDVFLRAYQSWHQLKDASLARAWLYRIARNRLYDLMRRQKLEQKHAAKELVADEVQFSVSFEETLAILDSFKSLADNHQQVLYLTIRGFSTEEIAHIMNRTTVATRVLLHRARKIFAERLRDPKTTGLAGQSKGGA
jgi:RNA polymerase sigma-70 factor (ECF subfamily)